MTDLYAEPALPERAATPGPAGSGQGPGPRPGAAGSRPGRTGGRSAAQRVCTPRRSPDFEGVRLPVLRSYRSQLRQEESRVSYWRRVVHARLDVVGARTGTGDAGSPRLSAVLSTPTIGSGRRALLRLHPSGGMPPLPDLAEMWDRVVPAGASDGRDRLLADLQDAERQLSAYRRALHSRLDAATAELIARYAEDPSLCLGVLPGARAS